MPGCEERATAVVNLGACYTTVWLLRSGGDAAGALDVATSHTVRTPATLLEVRRSRLDGGKWQLLGSYLHELVTCFALAMTYPTILLIDPDDSDEFGAYVERWLRTTHVTPCTVHSANEDAMLPMVTRMPAALFTAVRHGVSDAALVIDIGYRAFRVSVVFDHVVAWQRVAEGCDGVAALLACSGSGAHGSCSIGSDARAERTVSDAVLNYLTKLRAERATEVTVGASDRANGGDDARVRDLDLCLADCVAAVQQTLFACIGLCRTHGLLDCLHYVVADGGAARSAAWRALLCYLVAQHLPTATLLYTQT